MSKLLDYVCSCDVTSLSKYSIMSILLDYACDVFPLLRCSSHHCIQIMSICVTGRHLVSPFSVSYGLTERATLPVPSGQRPRNGRRAQQQRRPTGLHDNCRLRPRTASRTMGIGTVYEASGQAPIRNWEVEVPDKDVTASISSTSKTVENGNLASRTIEGIRHGNLRYAPFSHRGHCFGLLLVGSKKVQNYHRPLVSAC